MTDELVPLETKEHVLTVKEAATSLTVDSPDTAFAASGLLHDIKAATTRLTTVKTDITRPALESLAKIKALFAPLETTLKEADRIVRAKVLAYQVAEQEKIEAEKAKIAARVEKGTMREDTAVAKLGAVGDVAKTEGIRVQTRRQLEIVDETLIPREYLTPDRERITRALFADIAVPGAKLVEKKILNVVG